MTTMFTPDHEWINIEDHEAAVVGMPHAIKGTGIYAYVIVHAEVAKNRGGKKGFVKLAFSGRHQRFVETVADAREFQGGNAKPRRSYSEDV